MNGKLKWSRFPNFKESEFAHGGPPMAESFMQRLQEARDICHSLTAQHGYDDIPFSISSGSRSEERNRQVGGKPDSAHLYGRACDIRVSSSRERFFIVKSLLLAGFVRIGIRETFIHVDNGDMITEINKDPYIIYL